MRHSPVGLDSIAFAVPEHYVDLVEGLSMVETVEDTTGIAKRAVIDWRQQPRGADLRPRVVLRDARAKGGPRGRLFVGGQIRLHNAL